MSRNGLFVCIVFASLQSFTASSIIYLIEGTHLDYLCPAKTETYPFSFSISFNGRNKPYVTCPTTDICQVIDSNASFKQNSSGIYLTVKLRDVQQFRAIDLVVCNNNNVEDRSTPIIVAKPVNPICESPKLTDNNRNVSVLCKTEKVYPQAACLFVIRNMTLLPLGTITYSHQNISINSNVYYESQCTWTSSLSNFEAGSYSFDVFILPNVTNDTIYGEQVTLNDSLILTKPTVLVHSECLNSLNIVDGYIKPSTTVDCLCILINEGNPPGSVTWLNEYGQNVGILLNNTAINLIISPSNDVKQYFCTGHTILKNGRLLISYKVNYAKGPSVCELKSEKTIIDLCSSRSTLLNIKCEVNVSNAIPGVKSLFYVNRTKISNLTDSQLVNNIYTVQTSLTTLTTAGDATVRCLAQNSKFNDSYTYCEQLIQVRAPPIPAPILSIGSQTNNIVLSIQENVVYIMKCVANFGIPPVSNVTVSCGNINGQTQSGNIFTSPVTFTRNMTGQNCTCTAQHITGCYVNKTASTSQLNVLYISRIKIFKLQNTSSVLENGTAVENGTLIQLMCGADGNPLPSLSIKKGNGTVINTQVDNDLALSKVMFCEDGGNYICQTKNEIEVNGVEVVNQMQTLTIYVTCPFQYGSTKYVQFTFNGTFGAFFSTNFEIFGYPEPTKFILSKYVNTSYIEIQLISEDRNQFSSADKKFKVSYSSPEPPIITVELKILTLNKSDFTNFTLSTQQNEFQNINYTFSIDEVTEMKFLSNDYSNTGAIIGGTIAAIVVVIIIIGVVFITRKYDLCKKNRSEVKDNNYFEMPVQERDQHNYETPTVQSSEYSEYDKVTELNYENMKDEPRNAESSDLTVYCKKDINNDQDIQLMNDTTERHHQDTPRVLPNDLSSRNVYCNVQTSLEENDQCELDREMKMSDGITSDSSSTRKDLYCNVELKKEES